jgi:nucleotidyltransferase/DNA polymerase involved in DNA repair
MPPRKIIHLAMDAFYASVEQHDDPELRDRCWPRRHAGCGAAASYEASAFGVRFGHAFDRGNAPMCGTGIRTVALRGLLRRLEPDPYHFRPLHSASRTALA